MNNELEKAKIGIRKMGETKMRRVSRTKVKHVFGNNEQQYNDIIRTLEFGDIAGNVLMMGAFITNASLTPDNIAEAVENRDSFIPDTYADIVNAYDKAISKSGINDHLRETYDRSLIAVFNVLLLDIA